MFNTYLSENRAVYEITWEKYGRAGQATDDNIIRRMRYANAPQCYVIRTLPVLLRVVHTFTTKRCMLYRGTVVIYSNSYRKHINTLRTKNSELSVFNLAVRIYS
jgi:hypothetical protein